MPAPSAHSAAARAGALRKAAELLAQGEAAQALAALAPVDAAADSVELLNLAAVCAARAGDAARAEQWWRAALARAPEAAELHFNLGLLCARAGRGAEAEAYYRTALARDPAHADAANNLGLLLARAGRADEAEAAYRAGLARTPRSADLALNLGALLLETGRPDTAEPFARAAVALDPDGAGARSNLGRLHAARGEDAEAEAHYRAALARDAKHAGAWCNLGVLLARQGRYAEAEQCYGQALLADANDARAWTDLGLLYEAQRRHDEAERCQRKALALAPDAPEILSNLANLLSMHRRRFAEAEALLLRALERRPDAAAPLTNLGVLYANQRRDDEAERLFRRALACDPDYQLAHLNLAFLLLAHARWAEGWAHHEARYDPRVRDNGIALPAVACPRWAGEPLAGKALLVWAEQGYGDELQFCRYLSALAARWDVRITYATKPALLPVMQSLAGVARVVAQGAEAPDGRFDYWTLPLSLPLRWPEGAGAPIATLPYLRAPAGRRETWRARIAQASAGARLRVGLVWRGNPLHHNDAFRSLPGLAALAPLWSVPGVRFVSLQTGAAAAEAQRPPAGQPLVALGHEFADFGDTAAALEALDLVVSVDSAVAHLAGALARPCWLVLPFYRCDWRWLRDRADTPWYPGIMTLYRQPRDGDWAAVVEALRGALAERARA